MKGLLMTHPERGVAEIMRLREALGKVAAADTFEAARKIAEEALAIWPEANSF
jgi:hypothetical protein